jgi:hypothetical protein
MLADIATLSDASCAAYLNRSRLTARCLEYAQRSARGFCSGGYPALEGNLQSSSAGC